MQVHHADYYVVSRNFSVNSPIMLKNFLAVGLGGATGAMLRYGVTVIVS